MIGTTQIDAINITLDLYPFQMTDEAFYEFCQRNKDYRFELDKRGKLIIMPPTFLETSRKNNEVNFQLTFWAKKDKTGLPFESDGMFTLPNGAKRAPDAFWITKEKYFSLTEEEREEKFARIIPDFVIELRSKTDNLKTIKEKMEEYIENGVRLGWLIDPYEKQVYIYRQNGEVEILDNPKRVSGEDVLQGFELDLAEIF
ncbi:MAG: Uma2 family endonuclease [Acidobacteriota bacterium]|jgi:Uma2 family endonuclease|nr:Uma2 family endonuclease [Acidobacteriota bacterium]